MKSLFLKTFLPTLLLSLGAEAATVGGVDLPLQHGDFKLQGAGLLRKGFIFKIYVGALYLENTNDVHRVLSDVPKRIDIHYFHHTPKKHMIRAAIGTLRKNLTAAEYDRLLPMIDELHDAYRDGAKGSFASIIFRPGEGLTYRFDDETIATIRNEEFANAYFSIWLGKEPSSRTVKEAMLKGVEVSQE